MGGRAAGGRAGGSSEAWGVERAIMWLNSLARYDPYRIEEPTSADGVLGNAAIRRAVTPIKVATGEHRSPKTHGGTLRANPPVRAPSTQES
jgi:hypothetical protein